MLRALGRVAREARLDAELRQIDIATAARVSEATISRLENARSWPLDPDHVIQAYEKECGLKVDEIWRRAIDS